MDDAIPIAVPSGLRSAVGLEYEETDSIKGVLVDLNGDGVRDYLIQSASSLCGNGGCVYALFDGATHENLGQFFGNPVYVRAERAHGYPLIETYAHSSAFSGTYTTYTFNGTTYVVTSIREVAGGSLDSLFATLRRIPMWRTHR